jgi:indole-3-glycerol phosphate synthase
MLITPAARKTMMLVAESGIHTRADVERLKKADASGILVGESLMKENDIAAKVRELIGAPNSDSAR